MNIIQLNPVIPVRIVAHPDWKGPIGNGMAIAWFQPNIDHHLTWIVCFDSDGTFWEVENPYVRARTNITWGRPSPDK